MFDFGFSELLLVAVIALLVLGPERLPRAAKMCGLWIRRARASWYSVKSQVERELADDELRRSLQETRAEFDSLKRELQQPVAEIEALRHDLQQPAAELGRLGDELRQATRLAPGSIIPAADAASSTPAPGADDPEKDAPAGESGVSSPPPAQANASEPAPPSADPPR